MSKGPKENPSSGSDLSVKEGSLRDIHRSSVFKNFMGAGLVVAAVAGTVKGVPEMLARPAQSTRVTEDRNSADVKIEQAKILLREAMSLLQQQSGIETPADAFANGAAWFSIDWRSVGPAVDRITRLNDAERAGPTHEIAPLKRVAQAAIIQKLRDAHRLLTSALSIKLRNDPILHARTGRDRSIQTLTANMSPTELDLSRTRNTVATLLAEMRAWDGSREASEE